MTQRLHFLPSDYIEKRPDNQQGVELGTATIDRDGGREPNRRQAKKY
jgi:hypothetical protein